MYKYVQKAERGSEGESEGLLVKEVSFQVKEGEKKMAKIKSS